MELDATTVTDGTTWSASICIIGAGPAGLALASGLRHAGRSVVLLESGVVDSETGEAELLVCSNGSADPVTVPGTRARGIGGTTRLWNTWYEGSRYAKYLPLDTVDLTTRSWVPWSGWPVTRATLEPWYQRAYTLAGLKPPVSPPPARPVRELRIDRFDLGPAEQFRSTIPAKLRSSSNVLLVRGATAIRFERTRWGRIAAVHWRTPRCDQGAVRADIFVLAAGGIENARFLLVDRASAGRTYPSMDWLGRGFMEHPIDRSLRLYSRGECRAVEECGVRTAVATGGATVGRIGFSPEVIEDERLPNLSVRFAETEAPRLALPARLRSSMHRLVPSQLARRSIGNALRQLIAWRGLRGPTCYPLLLDLEQWPSRENRVSLSSQRDVHGQPLAVLHWEWRAEEEARRMRAQSVVARELQRANLGTVQVIPNIPIDPYAHHHAGTTRMHEDEGQGVVGADLRVHGEENLYVVGSSVFPTAGVANPTLTILALSARLADHLAG